MKGPLTTGKHPEVESSIRLRELLKNRHSGTGHVPDIDVLDAAGLDYHWHRNLNNDGLKDLLSKPMDPWGNPEKPRMRIFFLKPVHDHWTNRDISVSRETIMMLQEQAGMSDLLIAGAYEPERWGKMGDACFLDNDPDNPAIFQLCYRYICGWDTSASFIQLSCDHDNATYFCLNYPARALQRFTEIIHKDPAQVHRKFLLDILAVSECLDAWQIVISRKRSQLVKQFERPFTLEEGKLKSPSFSSENPVQERTIDDATQELHILSRDWHILWQDISDFEEQITFLMSSHKRYCSQFETREYGTQGKSYHPQWPGVRGNADSLQFLFSRCKIFGRWVINYKERTNIRINLLFQLVNQGEARTSTEIATSSTRIAEQTQRDSASMITIAAVTLVFLPGTFISGICSTIFFDFNDGELLASRKWWILPATVLPSTLLVLCVWLLWWHVRLSRDQFRVHFPGKPMPWSAYLSLQPWRQWSKTVKPQKEGLASSTSLGNDSR